MSTAALIVAVLALALGSYAAWLLTKLIRTLDAVTHSVDGLTSKVESLEEKLLVQEKELARLRALHQEQAKPAPVPHGLEGIAGLISGGKPQWSAIAALGMKLFAAYWKRRQGKQSPLPQKSATEADRNRSV